MDLRAAFVGVTHVTLTWKNDNITDTCRMLLEGSQESTKNLMVNIFELKPGSQYTVTLYPLGSNETQGSPLSTENGLGESQRWASDPQGLEGRDEVTLVSLPASFKRPSPWSSSSACFTLSLQGSGPGKEGLEWGSA